MNKKELLIACRKAYREKGCRRIEVIHDDGTVSGIGNRAAIAAAIDALVREADRQIASA